ncbi:MAG: DUF2061 domain-containing protein [Promethearchaeota archaeon]|nr:MAG: DUF2061 domain-containing protein [Candidatus Lokiarchaeota archaeon]
MKHVKNLEWKESLVKSLIYRFLTIFLGFLTAFFVTGSFIIALGVAILTELVQFVFYFVYEIIWTNLITRKRIIEEIRQTIDLQLNYNIILELAYQMSQINTFVGDVYLSARNFLKSILENEQLKSIRDEVSKYYHHFEYTHRNREFTTYGEKLSE